MDFFTNPDIEEYVARSKETPDYDIVIAIRSIRNVAAREFVFFSVIPFTGFMLSVIVVAAAMVLREPTPSPLLLVGIEIVIMVACSVVFVPLKNERWRMRVRQLRELRQTQPSANTILSTMALYDWILKELTLASISQENDGYE